MDLVSRYSLIFWQLCLAADIWDRLAWSYTYLEGEYRKSRDTDHFSLPNGGLSIAAARKLCSQPDTPVPLSRCFLSPSRGQWVGMRSQLWPLLTRFPYGACCFNVNQLKGHLFAGSSSSARSVILHLNSLPSMFPRRNLTNLFMRVTQLFIIS